MATAAPADVLPFPAPMTLDDISAGAETEYKRIDGFKPGKCLVIKSILASEFIEWQEAVSGAAKKNAGLKLIIASVVDGEPGKDANAVGKLLMTSESIGMLGRLPIRLTERIMADIVAFNGLNIKGGKTEAETAAKNA